MPTSLKVPLNAIKLRWRWKQESAITSTEEVDDPNPKASVTIRMVATSTL